MSRDYWYGANAWRLWLFLGVLWFATMPWRPLLDPDEGRYAEIPREMWVSGDWLTPHLDGLKYFEKPPLQYWATAAVYTVFGSSEWTSRLWAATLGFLCLPLVYGFSRRIGQSRDTALIAALLLAINPYFVITGHVNLLDQAFSFFLVASVFSFALAQRETRNSDQELSWMLCAWAALALAVLSKGIVAIVLTGMTLAIHMTLTRDVSVLRRMHFLTGLPLFAAIAAPWFWLVQQRNPEFAGFFFVHEHFTRFLTTVHHRTGAWWYFLAVLFFALTPVLWSIGPAIAQGRQKPAAVGEFQVGRFLWIWCIVVLGFFSFSQSKLTPYILPMMPPLALLMAQAVHGDRRARGRAAIALGVTTLIVGIALLALCWRRSGAVDPGLAGWVMLAAAIGLMPAFVGFRMAAAESQLTKWVALAAASIIAYQTLIMAYSMVPPGLSARTLAMQVKPHVSPKTELFSVGQFHNTLPFYLERTLQVVSFTGELEFGLDQAGNAAKVDLQRFRELWDPSLDAIAFIEPALYQKLVEAKLPGRVLANDGRTVAVIRR
ncbi:MAG: hypothetical protein HW417_1099 [Steroidobacteraceae bacterium]|nr:hypothetical protein [Steroidobacteraceae bacterium]